MFQFCLLKILGHIRFDYDTFEEKVDGTEERDEGWEEKGEKGRGVPRGVEGESVK